MIHQLSRVFHVEWRLCWKSKTKLVYFIVDWLVLSCSNLYIFEDTVAPVASPPFPLISTYLLCWTYLISFSLLLQGFRLPERERWSVVPDETVTQSSCGPIFIFCYVGCLPPCWFPWVVRVFINMVHSYALYTSISKWIILLLLLWDCGCTYWVLSLCALLLFIDENDRILDLFLPRYDLGYSYKDTRMTYIGYSNYLKFPLSSFFN